MTLEGRIGVFGGTLDPIHFGHLDAVEAARVWCRLDTVLLMPTRQPPHRPAQPQASEHHRFAMTELAAAGRDDLLACDMELRADGPSYTSVTLRRLADRGVAAARLFFITGADAFAEIETWHDYPAVLDRSHFVVVARPGHPVEPLRDRLPDLRSRMREPGSRPADRPEPAAIWLVDTATRDVSSSAIRQHLAEGRPIGHLVPAAVAHYIATHALYAPLTGKGLA